MHPLTKKVLASIQAHRLTRPGQTILIGVSGGPDSMALLHIFFELKLTLGIRLLAGHVNHGLRPAAKKDASFVKKACQHLNIPFFCKEIRVRRLPRKSSLEELAREQRFAALITIAQRKQADTIALAHHRDDLTETVLMRILRGSGLEGLQAILPERQIHGMPFIRPLLEISRAEIEKYLTAQGIPFRRDPTNRQTRFLRNKIRHELLPLLEKSYQPQIRRILAQLAQTAAFDYDLLEEHAKKNFLKSRSAGGGSERIILRLSSVQKLHPSMRRLVLRESFAQLKGDKRQLTLGHIQETEDMLLNRPTDSAVDLPAGIRVVKAKNQLLFQVIKPC